MTDDVKIPPLPETLKQIVYALQRQANALQAQADKLSDQLDYSAEFPAEDAERMREAIQIVLAVGGAVGPTCVLCAGLDPWPNPGDPVIADALRAPDDYEAKGEQS